MPININRDAVQRMISDGAQVVEVLAAKEYEPEHLPTAINIPLETLRRETAGKLDSQRPIIVYCWDYQ